LSWLGFFLASSVFISIPLRADIAKLVSPATAPKAPVTSEPEDEPEELKWDRRPEGQRWIQIWKQNDFLQGLRDFQTKYGLLLMTNKKVGEFSFAAEDQPCGEVYTSLVKTSQEIMEDVWEIDASGKILKNWHTGDNEILRVDGPNLFVRTEFFEHPSDFSLFNESRKTVSHKFILGIDALGKIEVYRDIPQNAKKWSTTEVKCPTGMKIESDFTYCVKDKKSGRLFVLQHPCT
jgi:hypothetical protein